MHLNISEKQSNRMLSITLVLNHEQMCLTFITVLDNIAVRHADNRCRCECCQSSFFILGEMSILYLDPVVVCILLSLLLT